MANGFFVHAIAEGAKILSQDQPDRVYIRCKNTSGGNLVGSEGKTASGSGSEWVEIDWANYTAGELVPIKALTASGSAINRAALGVVHQLAGTVADAGICLVQIYGEHPSAKVDGTSAVTKGEALVPFTTAGAVRDVGATPEDNDVVGYALEAHSDAQMEGKSVFICNPSNIPF